MSSDNRAILELLVVAVALIGVMFFAGVENGLVFFMLFCFAALFFFRHCCVSA